MRMVIRNILKACWLFAAFNQLSTCRLIRLKDKFVFAQYDLKLL